MWDSDDIDMGPGNRADWHAVPVVGPVPLQGNKREFPELPFAGAPASLPKKPHVASTITRQPPAATLHGNKREFPELSFAGALASLPKKPHVASTSTRQSPAATLHGNKRESTASDDMDEPVLKRTHFVVHTPTPLFPASIPTSPSSESSSSDSDIDAYIARFQEAVHSASAPFTDSGRPAPAPEDTDFDDLQTLARQCNEAAACVTDFFSNPSFPPFAL